MRFFVSNEKGQMHYEVSGNLISKEGFLHHRRTLPCYVFIMVKEGILYLNQNGNFYEVKKDQYILLPAGEEHYGYKPSEGRLSYYWVHFRFPGQVQIFREKYFIEHYLTGSIGEIHTEMDHYHRMQGCFIPEYGQISLTQRAPVLFHQLLDLSRQEMLFSKDMKDYALSLLLMEISQEYYDNHNNNRNNIPSSIARIMEWIRVNYDKDLSVSKIADEFHYNKDYLASIFKSAIGMTLSRYLNHVRINIAKTLLINYDISIKEVAYTCGYEDEKYFMKVFKVMEGVTATQYRTAFYQINMNRCDKI